MRRRFHPDVGRLMVMLAIPRAVYFLRILEPRLKRRVSVIAVVLLSLSATFSTEARRSTCALPIGVTKELPPQFVGWRLLQVSDLVEDDQALWSKAQGKKCPGLAGGHFTDRTSPELAFSLIDPKARKQAVLLAKQTSAKRYDVSVVSPSTQATNFLVIHALPPGTYRGFENRRTVRTQFDSVAYELIESAMDMIYFKNGSFRTLALSE